ncbi:MAG: hypothetical protein SGILL_010496 [Bacillariaceae sp.]
MEPTGGLLFAATVVLMLSLSTSENSILGFSVTDAGELNEVAFATATRVIDASVPTSSTDYVAIALGESIAGVIGAAFSVGINVLLRPDRIVQRNKAKEQDETSNSSSTTNPFVSQALSDSDYFIANSATDSLLVAIGVAPEVAKLSSVFIAAVPSQLVKLIPVIREQRAQEELLLQQLLLEQQLQVAEASKQNMPNNLLSMLPFSTSRKEEAAAAIVANPKDLIPVTGTIGIDFVEVFADVTRWLEYDVLKREFAGTLVWNNQMLDPSMTGAVLGLLAAVSSRLYADVLYQSYGPVSKQEEVRSRPNIEWLSRYFATAASAATLFGFYEASQGPIFRWIQGTLAGGVEGCVGSSSFDACLQTYIDTNSPGASPEAQARALATNLFMVGQRLQDIAVDTTFDDVAALVRAWAVTLVSYLNHLTASVPSAAAGADLPSTNLMLSHQTWFH